MTETRLFRLGVVGIENICWVIDDGFERLTALPESVLEV